MPTVDKRGDALFIVLTLPSMPIARICERKINNNERHERENMLLSSLPSALYFSVAPLSTLLHMNEKPSV
jgi:hypothetical protein